jgi:hypothetical protein
MARLDRAIQRAKRYKKRNGQMDGRLKAGHDISV